MALQADAGGVLATQIGDAFSEIPKLCPELLESNVHVSQNLSSVLDGQVSGELCDLCQDVVLSALTEEERQKHITVSDLSFALCFMGLFCFYTVIDL